MKVLILITSQFFQHVLKRHLSFLSREALFVNSVKDFKNEFEGGEFDIVCIERFLSDGSSGLELCKELRAHPAGAKTPVILLTISDDPKLAAECDAAGVTKVFKKNDIEHLADYVAQLEKDYEKAGTVSGHVLLVEDSAMVANIINVVLNNIGLTVETFSKAEDAWAALSKKEFDVVISDVNLEGNMTGLGLVRAIRKLEGKVSRIPILAISGMQDNARKVELLRSGADDFASKPLLNEELEMRVRNMLQHKRLFEEVEAQRDHMRKLAMTDQLTGLFNRHYMAEVASKRMQEAIKHGIAVSFLILDLDHFKKINDTHGHDVGDVVLAETAHLLRDSCRSGDTASRAGGEEFVLILINRDAANAAKFAEIVRQGIENLNPGGIHVTGSIGVASVKKGTQSDFKTLFKIADEAVYEAKTGGRNRVVIKEVAA